MISVCDGCRGVMVLCRNWVGVWGFLWCGGLLLVLMRSVIPCIVLLQYQALIIPMLCRGSGCRLLWLLQGSFNLGRRALEFVTYGKLVGWDCSSRCLMRMMLSGLMLIHLVQMMLITTFGCIGSSSLLLKFRSRTTTSRSMVVNSLILRSSHLFQSNRRIIVCIVCVSSIMLQ